MLNVYIHDDPDTLRFVLAGKLENGQCQQLAGAWETAMSIASGKRLVIDTSSVESLDDDGKALLVRLRTEGATVVERTTPASANGRRDFGSWLCRTFGSNCGAHTH